MRGPIRVLLFASSLSLKLDGFPLPSRGGSFLPRRNNETRSEDKVPALFPRRGVDSFVAIERFDRWAFDGEAGSR